MALITRHRKEHLVHLQDLGIRFRRCHFHTFLEKVAKEVHTKYSEDEERISRRLKQLIK